jgi:hypothetical protein
MSVQMIELEEVTMVETTDEALEAAQGGVGDVCMSVIIGVYP